jgi:dihydrofolate reductase
VPKIVVINHLTLDGVMQAPGRPDEDDRGGFEHGGWSRPYGDPVMGAVMGERMARGAALLLGRRTYEDFAGFWPRHRDNPFSEVLDGVQKYVASTTLREPLPWRNSTLLEGDAAATVARLYRVPDEADLPARLGADLFHAVRADLLRRLGRDDEAALAYEAALDRTDNAAERDFLRRRVRLASEGRAS